LRKREKNTAGRDRRPANTSNQTSPTPRASPLPRRRRYQRSQRRNAWREQDALSAQPFSSGFSRREHFTGVFLPLLLTRQALTRAAGLRGAAGRPSPAPTERQQPGGISQRAGERGRAQPSPEPPVRRKTAPSLRREEKFGEPSPQRPPRFHPWQRGLKQRNSKQPQTLRYVSKKKF